MGLDLNKFRIRAVSAAVFAVILVSCVYYSYYSFLALFFVVALWALYEFYELANKMGHRPYAAVGMISGVLTFMSIFSLQLPANCADVILFRYGIFLVPFIVAIRFLFTRREHAFHELAFTIAGIFYCVIPFALLVQIPTTTGSNVSEIANNYDYFKVLGIIFLMWTNDTFAYIGGSMFGKKKLFERVSPGKTWEGTIIGVLFCVVVGFLLNCNGTFSSQWVWPLIALFVGVFGTMGDLIESLMKRKAGVKDSSSLMPGHGGILDRFDSLMFVSPFVFVILKLAESAH
jgi:phosphatidate cytidylyltransferase